MPATSPCCVGNVVVTNLPCLIRARKSSIAVSISAPRSEAILGGRRLLGQALSAARQAAAEAATVPRPLCVSALRLQWYAAHADNCRSARHGVPQGSFHHGAGIGRSSSPVGGM